MRTQKPREAQGLPKVTEMGDLNVCPMAAASLSTGPHGLYKREKRELPEGRNVPLLPLGLSVQPGAWYRVGPSLARIIDLNEGVEEGGKGWGRSWLEGE